MSDYCWKCPSVNIQKCLRSAILCHIMHVFRFMLMVTIVTRVRSTAVHPFQDSYIHKSQVLMSICFWQKYIVERAADITPILNRGIYVQCFWNHGTNSRACSTLKKNNEVWVNMGAWRFVFDILYVSFLKKNRQNPPQGIFVYTSLIQALQITVLLKMLTVCIYSARCASQAFKSPSQC